MPSGNDGPLAGSNLFQYGRNISHIETAIKQSLANVLCLMEELFFKHNMLYFKQNYY